MLKQVLKELFELIAKVDLPSGQFWWIDLDKGQLDNVEGQNGHFATPAAMITYEADFYKDTIGFDVRLAFRNERYGTSEHNVNTSKEYLNLSGLDFLDISERLRKDLSKWTDWGAVSLKSERFSSSKNGLSFIDLSFSLDVVCGQV